MIHSHQKDNKIQNFDRPAKVGFLNRAGKKEGVWGRNFCLPVLFRSEFAQTPIPRRPPPFGRRDPASLPDRYKKTSFASSANHFPDFRTVIKTITFLR